jgi:hypothetical protein
MNDAADHPSVVDPTRSRLITRQQWFDRRPLPIVEPELARRLQRSVDSVLESLPATGPDNAIGRSPGGLSTKINAAVDKAGMPIHYLQ